MSPTYTIHRTDSNAAYLTAYLEAHGCSVWHLGQPLDVLVCLRRTGQTAVADFKTLTGKLRPKQVEFIARWPGVSAVLRTEADCQALIRVLGLCNADRET